MPPRQAAINHSLSYSPKKRRVNQSFSKALNKSTAFQTTIKIKHSLKHSKLEKTARRKSNRFPDNQAIIIP
uniref:hypothetical protein n=1 Tax=Okeania sp. SIO2F4 TaxID=2607790 RepID=UPI0025CFCD80|nr:hypothetical protein [Okeania sp. SIO2F4]